MLSIFFILLFARFCSVVLRHAPLCSVMHMLQRFVCSVLFSMFRYALSYDVCLYLHSLCALLLRYVPLCYLLLRFAPL